MISLRSKITKKLLNYFFLNPQENLYVNELSRRLNLDKRNLIKKLGQLEKEGILKSQRQGNLKLYSINKRYSLYKEYKNIVLKTVGFEGRLKKILNGIRGISKAYVYGSYAKDNLNIHSDIDLLVVGKHNIVLLQRKLNNFQKEMGREINIVNMGEKEFKKRIGNEDPFINSILRNKNIKVI